MGKSDLHIELAWRALVWLEARATGRGIRGCEEVGLADGYVADSAAISGLTIANEKVFGVGSDRWRSEAADDYAWIFESKVSRSDYFNTFKSGNRLTPIGNFHFVVTPKNLVTPDEVPTFWGLLEKSGQGLSIKKLPQLSPLPAHKLYEIAYLILRASHFGKFTLYTERADELRAQQEIVDKLT